MLYYDSKYVDGHIVGGHLSFLLTLSKKSQKTAHFEHIRQENDFEVSTQFLNCSKFKKQADTSHPTGSALIYFS